MKRKVVAGSLFGSACVALALTVIWFEAPSAAQPQPAEAPARADATTANIQHRKDRLARYHNLARRALAAARNAEDRSQKLSQRHATDKLQATIETLTNTLFSTLDSAQGAPGRTEVIHQFVSLVLDDQQTADFLSAELTSRFRLTDDPRKRELLAAVMLVAPGTANRELGEELITSPLEEERLIGYELARSTDLIEDIGHPKLNTKAVWHDDTEDVSISAIDTFSPPADREARAEAVSDLSEVVAYHSSPSVRATALLKIAEIDPGEETQRRIEEALTEGDDPLKLAAAMAVKRSAVRSPIIKAQLSTIVETTDAPRLRNLARELLRAHD